MTADDYDFSAGSDPEFDGDLMREEYDPDVIIGYFRPGIDDDDPERSFVEWPSYTPTDDYYTPLYDAPDAAACQRRAQGIAQEH